MRAVHSRGRPPLASSSHRGSSGLRSAAWSSTGKAGAAASGACAAYAARTGIQSNTAGRTTAAIMVAYTLKSSAIPCSLPSETKPKSGVLRPTATEAKARVSCTSSDDSSKWRQRTTIASSIGRLSKKPAAAKSTTCEARSRRRRLSATTEAAPQSVIATSTTSWRRVRSAMRPHSSGDAHLLTKYEPPTIERVSSSKPCCSSQRKMKG